MKSILCYGDSNTFGSNPLGGRHPYDVRWTGRLQQLLGSEYRIIEEGCGGRTTVFEDEIELGRCGRTSLPVCLSTHKPIDLIILMLGTNDLKARFGLTAWDLQHAMEQLLRIIDTYPFAPWFMKPQVLLVSPIEIGPRVAEGPFGCFAADAAERSRLFPVAYRAAAAEYDAHFFDAATIASPSKEDQLHMDAASHAALADALCAQVHAILG